MVNESKSDFTISWTSGWASTDVIVFSGSLNTLPQARAEQTLESAWAATAEALVFNFLSDRTGRPPKPESGPARRFDSLALLRWAMDRTPLVRFRQDYLKGNDADDQPRF